MSASAVGAVILLGAALILIYAIKTAPERRRRRTAHPLQDAYREPTDDEEQDAAPRA
jgi:hypothetical protein